MRRRMQTVLAVAGIVLGSALAGVAPASAEASPAARHATSASIPESVVTQLESAVQQARKDGRSAAAPVVCYTVHIRDYGWQSPRCNSETAGSVGQNTPIEAILIQTAGTGGFCVNAHLQNTGWQGTRCGADDVQVPAGSTGQAVSVEALDINLGWTRGANTGAQGHVQNYGWQAAQYRDWVRVGTTGENRTLEAVRIWP
ncbi:hypothetical protein [Streptomyces zagrosensis]|uniref:Uncharacterized protein YjdB n=1 Tax=Streptomyces zagrosensis TaxID=1042984 RepID=A0A7W9QEH1_9ACTN|nr:hypothetical protein [Streptomyces zagrosensis]MBB5938554.1 uncharacterized protein YjdB [Streptomyces zagrosensis]